MFYIVATHETRDVAMCSIISGGGATDLPVLNAVTQTVELIFHISRKWRINS